MQFLNKLSLLLILTLLCINNVQADTENQYKQAENDAETILESVDKLIAIKKYDLAESLLLTGIDSAEKVMGENTGIIITRPLFVRLADVYQDQKKYDKSKVIWLYILDKDKDFLLLYIGNKSKIQGSLTKKNLVISELNKKLAEDYYNLGSNQYSQNDIEAATASFLSSLKIYINTPLKDDDLFGRICVRLGVIRREQSKYDDAETLFLQALEVAEKLYGKDGSITQYSGFNSQRYCYQI